MPSRTRTALPTLLLALALAGCTAEVRGSAQQSTPAPTTPAATTSAATTSAASTPLVSVGASAAVRVETKTTTFRSPTGNIGCEVSTTQAYCDIEVKDWKPTPKPATCEWDWGFGVHVEQTGKADFNCASDTVLNPGATPLAYDTAVQVGNHRCTSRRDGMHCLNTRTKHGFDLSKDSYRLF
jgi:hypothetical protein